MTSELQCLYSGQTKQTNKYQLSGLGGCIKISEPVKYVTLLPVYI